MAGAMKYHLQAPVSVCAAMAILAITTRLCPVCKVHAQGTGSVEVASFLLDPVQMQCQRIGFVYDHHLRAVIAVRGTFNWFFFLRPKFPGWMCTFQVNSSFAFRSFSATVPVWPASRECIDCMWTIIGDGLYRNGSYIRGISFFADEIWSSPGASSDLCPIGINRATICTYACMLAA